jgi:hypothetical protein
VYDPAQRSDIVAAFEPRRSCRPRVTIRGAADARGYRVVVRWSSEGVEHVRNLVARDLAEAQTLARQILAAFATGRAPDDAAVSGVLPRARPSRIRHLLRCLCRQ